jgi:hypothetical protein
VAEKWSLGPFQGPNEELAFKHLAENLPDDWFVIANRQLDTPKHEEVDLKKDAIKDFQKLTIAKGLPTINMNRYRNEEFYKYGQMMDKDVPIF